MYVFKVTPLSTIDQLFADLIFDTTTPCTLESLSDRPTKGTKYDDLKYKRRVSSVHPGHGAIAEYAHTLRFGFTSSTN